jgi:transcriptional regulator with XRE-family HTH domain
MDDEGLRQFGVYLRSLREAARLTQSEVALRAGFHSTAYYGQLERGQRGLPSRRLLRCLDTLYGLPPGTIQGRARSLDPFEVWLDTVGGVSPEALDAAFESAWADHEYFNSLRGDVGARPLTVRQKAFFVWLHARSTGRDLLAALKGATP